MDTIKTGVLIAHTVIALVIIVLVLLQRGKGADAGAAFGAGASGTVFGSRGSGSFFSRMTGILATVFFVTSLTLAYLAGQSTGQPASLLEGAPAVETEEVAIPQPADEQGLPELPASDEDSEAADESGLPTLPPENGNVESDPAEPEQNQ